MQIRMPYGGEIVAAALEWGRVLDTLDIADTPALEEPDEALAEGLENPIGQSGPVLGQFHAGEQVAIVVSDSFRATGIDRLLPRLLDGLEEAGCSDEDIFFLFSTGSHRGPTDAEAMRILGTEVYQRFRHRAFTHDPADAAQLVHVGDTSRGTPVHLNRRLLEADRVIVTGTVVLHYFGGFGGGRKSIVPGLAGLDTIAHNHALNLHREKDELDPAVRIGVLDGNPVAEDMLEGAEACAIDCLINTVLNRDGEIAGVFVGDMNAAHRAACEFARSLYAVNIRDRADVVIASAGKARNYIQSHKALFNAYQAVKPGGRIIFLAEAPEGFGGNKFTQWLNLGSRERIIAELRKNAEINGQTALSTIEKGPITLFVTELSAEQCALMGGRKADSLDAALAVVRDEMQQSDVANPSVYLMPSASYTVPFLA